MLFEKPEDDEAFERVLKLAHQKVSLPIYAYCVMPNHWHFVVQPETDTQVTDFFRWMPYTHTMRWHVHYQTEGTGHVYQGRFKTFPIEDDEDLLAVLRYVERNALQANMVKQAEDWKYSSLWRAFKGSDESKSLLSAWPIAKPRTWRAMVNRPQNEKEVKAVRKCVKKDAPVDRIVL